MSSTKALSLCALVSLAGAASAAAPTDADVFFDSPRVRALPALPKPVQARVDAGRVTSVEPRHGVPTFFFAPAGGPSPSLADQGVSPEQAARRVLFDYAPLYRAPPSVLAEARLASVHDTGAGAVLATFEQRVAGVPVFRDRLVVVMNRRYEVVALSGYLSPARKVPGDFLLADATALSVAWGDLSGAPVDARAFQTVGVEGDGYRRLDVGGPYLPDDGPLLVEPARARPVYFALPTHLEPAFYVELNLGRADATDSDFAAYVVSAVDGRVLWRKSLTDLDVVSYRVWADAAAPFLPMDGPQGTAATPHPTGTPNQFQPAYVAPNLVALANGPISTNDAWLPTGATETTGNNVEAYADLTAPDGFNAGDLRATSTATNTFDRVFDPTLTVSVSDDQRMAVITQLFFDINFLHDWFYDAGFNEVAGNAQALNFGRGGEEADSIKAEAQDVAGTNNANMSTPADGSRPRMQMYVWRRSPPIVVTTSAGTFTGGAASFGPQTYSLSGTLVLGDDGAGSLTDGCEPLLNAVAGRVVLLDRGACTFGQKALNAQAAGALGVVIANNTGTTANTLGGTPSSPVTIPALSVSLPDGASLKSALLAGAVTLSTARLPPFDRPGSLDNTIVAHEWGHYLSNRLVGNGGGVSGLQSRGMGEGWGDFVGLLLAVRAGDAQVAANANFAGVYASASYSVGRPGDDAYYFGIRRYPNSTDLSKNPLTFKHIADGTALPTGVPLEPGPAANSEVHNTGEVWAVMLWECYAALLRDSRLTFAQAQSRMLGYLVAGLKATPARPTFTEARDAMLAVAVANDVRDFQAFATAFARRGLGLDAVAPPRTTTDNTPVVEDFTTGNALQFVSAELTDEAFFCDRDGVLDAGERGRLTLTLKNVGFGALSATTGVVTSTTPGVLVANGGVVSFGSSTPFGTTTGTAEVVLTGATAPLKLDFTIAFTDTALATPGPRTATASFFGHHDSVPASSATETVEARTATPWTLVKDTAVSSAWDWAIAGPTEDRHWLGVDATSLGDFSLVSPPLTVAATGTFSFTFRAAWDFEADATTNWDGAVLELSTDNGATWSDLGASATPGYGGALGTTAGNPLAGRQAWVGRNASWPAEDTVTVNLGTTYAGQTVQVRFRIATDQAAGETGMTVDDVAFTGLTNTPFAALVADRGLCINRPPVANAGADFAADERAAVTLDATGSFDPDMDTMTYRWTQVDGPAVALTAGAFTAPEVSADTALTFELIANDGTVDSAPDRVVVTVRHVSLPPVAQAGPAQTVEERTRATLTATGTDPDGDALTFSWVQVAGPAVELAAEGASASFLAPEVTEDTALQFAVRANDGALDSPAAFVDVLVVNVNRAPVVQVRLDQLVESGAAVVLRGTGSDPDGDALTFAWTQVGGPPVKVTVDGATGTFTAPVVTEQTVLTFALTASDGALSSDAATSQVTVLKAWQAQGCGCTSGGGEAFSLLSLLLAGLALRRRRA